ncbi:MAG: hypothetical protein RIT81_22480 [Deltaproteobacteria bacterium]
MRPARGSPKSKGKGSPKTKGKSHGKARSAPGLTEEEAEEAAGFERRHAAEIEEEGRRHTSVDADAELQRLLDEEEDDQKVKGLNWDDERKKRGRQPDQDDDDTEDGEAAAAAAAEAKKQGFATDGGAGKYFQDMPEDRMGDLSLTDPNEMKRALGPSVRFAQHAMLLAEERMKAGEDRGEALALLASLYTGVADTAYANKALKDFGHATGIIDLYPLELMDHLLQHVPGFCTKVRHGSFFAPVDGEEASERRVGRAGVPLTLRYDPTLRVRGFAIKGGARPGYLFEPIDPPGSYQLVFLQAGTFEVLLSAISKDGWLLIESVEFAIEENTEEIAELTGIERERDHDHVRPDEERPKKNKDDDLKIHFPKRI